MPVDGHSPVGLRLRPRPRVQAPAGSGRRPAGSPFPSLPVNGAGRREGEQHSPGVPWPQAPGLHPAERRGRKARERASEPRVCPVGGLRLASAGSGLPPLAGGEESPLVIVITVLTSIVARHFPAPPAGATRGISIIRTYAKSAWGIGTLLLLSSKELAEVGEQVLFFRRPIGARADSCAFLALKWGFGKRGTDPVFESRLCVVHGLFCLSSVGPRSWLEHLPAEAFESLDEGLVPVGAAGYCSSAAPARRQSSRRLPRCLTCWRTSGMTALARRGMPTTPIHTETPRQAKTWLASPGFQPGKGSHNRKTMTGFTPVYRALEETDVNARIIL